MPPVASYSLPHVGSVKLGRIKPATPRAAPLFAAYVGAALPTPPATFDASPSGAVYPMYANDRFGDCVFATVGHHFGLWTAAGSPPEKLFSDDEVLAMYSAVTGFDPRDPRTDNGAVIVDALSYECTPGKGMGGKTAAAFARVSLGQGWIQFKQACWLFGGLHLGVELPLAWQRHTGPGQVWDVGSGRDYQPGSWGGHSVLGLSYDTAGIEVLTWGQKQRVTWRAVQTYFDEAYALVSWDYVAGTKPAPSGFDTAALVADWLEMSGTVVVPPSPPSPPTPPPAAGVITIDMDARKVTLPPYWSASYPQG